MEADVRKIIYLDSDSSRRRISKYFSETWFSSDGAEAGLSRQDICSPILPLHLCGWESIGTPSPAWAQQGEPQAGLDVLLAHRRASQGAEPRAGGQHGGTQLSPRGSHLGHPQSAQFAHSTNPATEKPPETSNIPHYVAFTTKIAACTAQAPPELSNKI